MYTLAKISIFINILACIHSSYLEAESNYRPKVERNNILNKGLWVKKKSEASPSSGLVFKTNSFDIDHVMDNNNDGNEDGGQSLPFFSGYVSRSKRNIQEPIETHTNRSKRCGNNECATDQNKSDISRLKSTTKRIPILNDSNNVAGLLSHTDHYNILHNIPPHVYTPVDPNTKYYIANITKDFEKIMKPIWNTAKEGEKNSPINIKNNDMFYSINDINSDPSNTSTYESPSLNKLAYGEKFNNSMKNTLHKNISNNKQSMWLQTAPVRINKLYNISDKSQENTNNTKSKIMPDKGLLKVLSMLSKTFKTIMEQHNDIKLIHNKLHNLNTDIMNNLEMLTKRFEDFDNKYNKIMKINEKLDEKEKIFDGQQHNFLNKEKELSDNLVEFGKQQKEFIKQQSQFYNIQKKMLEQNEKITSKQAQIVKSQHDISLKQNHLSKLLKRIQHISASTYQKNGNVPKKVIVNKTNEKGFYSRLATTLSPNTESVKIDLFSIPPLKELKNFDKDILKDKDEEAIDDLIYKYYFNNTFIAEMIKNKLLANVINVSEYKHNSKKRKPRKNSTTTLLLPINSVEKPKRRERRWIRRPKKKIQMIASTTPIATTNSKLIETKKGKPNTDPFIKMAMTFCTELNQDQNVQAFNWCVEKALRRLQVIDFNLTSTPKITNNLEQNNTVPSFSSDHLKSSDTSDTPTQTASLKEIATEASSGKYFPDNDELETNLKQYDLKPDLEGNVYFDGSLHISDIGHIDMKDLDSDGFSDIIPGFDSNSKIEVDPAAIELQAQRRADVRRINEKINRIKMA